MEKTKQKVENLADALSVFMQVAHLAQSKGILSLDDAVLVKGAIDFVEEMKTAIAAQQAARNETPDTEGE